MGEPILQALVVADLVHPIGMGKFAIIGTFRQLWIPSVPGVITANGNIGAYVYVNLTELNGDYEFRVRVKRIATDEVMLESPPIKLKSDNPLASVEFALGLPPIQVNAFGAYEVELVNGDSLVGSYRMEIAQLRLQGETGTA